MQSTRTEEYEQPATGTMHSSSSSSVLLPVVSQGTLDNSNVLLGQSGGYANMSAGARQVGSAMLQLPDACVLFQRMLF
jgi:hypothetical protein